MKLSLTLLLLVVLPLAIHSTDSVPAKVATTPKAAPKTDSKKPSSSENLCGENTLAVLDGSDNLNFTLLNKKEKATYKGSDFEVKQNKVTTVNHPFWKWFGKYSNLHRNFIKMGCQVGG